MVIHKIGMQTGQNLAPKAERMGGVWGITMELLYKGHSEQGTPL